MINAETELSNKLADYAKHDWINSSADVYGKLESEMALERLQEAAPDFSTEEDMLTSKMSELLNNPEDEELKSEVSSQRPPLPTESEIENMLAEIRQLEQEEIQSTVENESKESDGRGGELKNVLSNIPSFSETSK